MRELNNTIIIAVDHGYGNIKTANTVIPTALTLNVFPAVINPPFGIEIAADILYYTDSKASYQPVKVDGYRVGRTFMLPTKERLCRTYTWTRGS